MKALLHPESALEVLTGVVACVMVTHGKLASQAAGVLRTRLPVRETQEMRVPFRGREDPLEKEMETHSTILAWRIPWAEEPGGLYSQWDCKESDMTERLTLSSKILFFFFFAFRTTYLCGPWDAIHFLNHKELLPQNPPS